MAMAKGIDDTAARCRVVMRTAITWLSSSSTVSSRQGIELPLVGDALEVVDAAIGEFEPRARDKVADGTRHQDLTGLGLSLP